jgi:hypothetical protein
MIEVVTASTVGFIRPSTRSERGLSAIRLDRHERPFTLAHRHIYSFLYHSPRMTDTLGSARKVI